MNCRDYQHQISLSLYEELPENERPGLDAHLQECQTCRFVFEEEKGLHFVLAEDAVRWDVPSDLLVESRRELANVLDGIENKRSWWRIPAFSVVLTPMRLLESAALVAMGLALGVYISNQQSLQVATTAPVPESSVLSAIPANGTVSNLRILSSNPATGQVELAGEIVQPLRMQSSMTDDTVVQLLIGALSSATNSGSRLRAVEVLSQSQGDAMVKDALIQALMYDDNPGVRLKAIQGLKQYVAQEDVRTAFMHTLKNDTDPGIRYEAVESLTALNSKDTELAKALTPFSKDDNNYVRMKVLQFVGSNR